MQNENRSLSCAKWNWKYHRVFRKSGQRTCVDDKDALLYSGFCLNYCKGYHSRVIIVCIHICISGGIAVRVQWE